MRVWAQAKNGDEQFWNIEISCSQWEGSACTQSALIFFLLSFGGGAEDFFFNFPLFPMFPMCSPKSSPSHLYRCAKGGGTLSFHRIFYFGKPPQSNWLISKRKKVGLVRHPQLINYETEISIPGFSQIYAPVISPGQKWWQTVLEREISCSQWEASACTHDEPCFCLLGEGGGRHFLFFFLVPNVFPTCSHHVPLRFPKLSVVP